MRIIGGKYKRKKLFSVPGSTTRPTSDRLRETLFNILSYDVVDAIVLDLFAGTGALGIEALSRSAKKTVFVDMQPDSVAVIKKNINACSFQAVTTVLKWDVCRNLNCLNATEELFNLVFIDPPYGKAMIPKALLNLQNSQCLADSARLVVEHAVSEVIDSLPECFSITDQRVYGKTAVSFLVFEKV